MIEATKLEGVVSVDPEIMGGEPVFAGTRVLVKTLFDYLRAGDPLDEFFDSFPTVNREQVQKLLAAAGDLFVDTLEEQRDSAA